MLSRPKIHLHSRASAQAVLDRWSDAALRSAIEDGILSEASPWILSARRRVLECMVALAALFFLIPAMALIAVLVLLASGWPIFFRQRRMGRHGREFTLYKFRSMRAGAGRSSCITISGDDRITRVGALLRRFKLDELPQFWNVLRGDMGLVGPRPKLPHHEGLRMTCRPGITGAATLCFRNEEELLAHIPADEIDAFYEAWIKPAKASMDFDYMRTATFSSDIRILWRTARECVAPPGSTEPGALCDYPLAEARDRDSRKVPVPR